ncbi:class I SAM-dependent RNA methyltransferase [Roseospira goensis]|uniref:23S rRNA (Uracil1939-C5)-methyltransferase n=1 Tax=Roseospira goensis TaxID=391922 RepID=A0A7W6WJY5_9PROT|nr:class I SAM-dependent RNA methyltransferase [Roseospira goensis]MBB4284968.1 23S rRNA (uracil1939-C5)-methyltransferase [Roseospira goensis]
MTRHPHPAPGRTPRRTGAGRRRPRARWTGPDPLDLTVDALGAQGDGLARHGPERLFLPGALPGERVRARVGDRTGDGWRTRVEAVLTPAPDRVGAPCPHFGPCGGCSLQHLAPPALTAWKHRQVVEALARRGLGAVTVDAVVTIPPGSRRRCTLAWRRTGAGVVLGFHAADSHRLEDVRTCALLTPRLGALLAPLRALLAAIGSTDGRRGPEAGQVSLTDTETGVDCTLTLPGPPDLAARERLAAFAEAEDVARLSGQWGETAEPVAERRAPVVRFAGVPVRLPPLAFLQPSPEGAAAITEAVLARLPAGTGPVLDLYAGLGTLSLPIAMTGRPVHAVDGTAEAIAALAAAPAPRGRLTTTVRDLARDPVDGAALATYGAAVFDPPRAGAAAQAAALAAHGPPQVVAVSCKPATFARDARTLVDGGYRLGPVTPIDQFPWSAHVEVVAVFRRDPT